MGNTSSTHSGAPAQAFGVQGAMPKTGLAAKLFGDKLSEMSTPGWQYLYKAGIFLILWLVFGILYQVVIGNNPEEWSHPTDENDKSIINGFYVSTVVNSTVGYGDYYPYSQRGILLIVFNILFAWILFSTVLG
jgi:hypothetical protein